MTRFSSFPVHDLLVKPLKKQFYLNNILTGDRILYYFAGSGNGTHSAPKLVKDRLKALRNLVFIPV
jgi:hypothetical protein